MDEYYSVIQFLPEPLRTELKAMPPERAARVQEIRLRAGQAVQFTVGGAWQPAQQLLPAAQAALAIGPRMLRSCFAALCRDSAYAYEDELKQGYFTLPGGSRVGVAGGCGPAGFADITSLNLRVARQVPCVLPPQLRRTLDALHGGILVVGTPGSGKTTFLRSIIRYLDTARRIFCVADERGELMTAGWGELTPARKEVCKTMEYASKDIRNILVAGHAGCGKTTLTEALLYLSGATERMGRVEDGTTASDFDPEEARRAFLM